MTANVTTNIEQLQGYLSLGEMFLQPIGSPLVSIAKSLVSIVQIVKGVVCSIFFGLATASSSFLPVSNETFNKCNTYANMNAVEVINGVKNLGFSLGNIVTIGLLSFILLKTGRI